MVKVRLSDVITFSLGDNPSRVKVDEANLYTQDDLLKDLSGENTQITNPKCVINLMRSNAAPLSKQTAKKKITSNFLCCDIAQEMLDPWYFCYQFNEGREIQQQINMYSQGTVLSVKRLNVQMISDMLIHLPDINKQRQIGKLYQHSIRQHDLMCKQAENMKTLTLAMIRKIEED